MKRKSTFLFIVGLVILNLSLASCSNSEVLVPPSSETPTPINAGKHTFIITRKLDGAGTEFLQYDEVWQENDQSIADEVLRFPKELSMTCMPPHWWTLESKSQTVKIQSEGEQLTVSVLMNGSYNYWDNTKGNILLFSKQVELQYVWNLDAHRFVFESAKPRLFSEWRVNSQALTGFSFYCPENEIEFLVAHSQELIELAHRGNENQKQWLTMFLSSTPDGKEKADFINLLGK